jgi:hypothetical protein
MSCACVKRGPWEALHHRCRLHPNQQLPQGMQEVLVCSACSGCLQGRGQAWPLCWHLRAFGAAQGSRHPTSVEAARRPRSLHSQETNKAVNKQQCMFVCLCNGDDAKLQLPAKFHQSCMCLPFHRTHVRFVGNAAQHRRCSLPQPTTSQPPITALPAVFIGDPTTTGVLRRMGLLLLLLPSLVLRRGGAYIGLLIGLPGMAAARSAAVAGLIGRGTPSV